MELDAFDYPLPEELIAQSPLERRDASRLMTLRPADGGVEHHAFSQLPQLLREGDLLVLNDARVVPARLLGKKAGTGGKVELLVVRPAAAIPTPQALSGSQGSEWICIGQASKALKAGQRVELPAGLQAEVLAALGEGEYRVRLEPGPGGTLSSALEEAGRLPLPPYITREPSGADRERYQTVFARSPGSAAAPTAGLHFTDALFEQLAARNIQRVFVTLDVGPGTFLPVRVNRIADHKMHPERFEVPVHTSEQIARARAEGRRIVAVGTTVVRTLEASWDPAAGAPRPGRAETSIFITPGYRFLGVDALITNFHLPRSTLLMLVGAFAGTEHALAAYREAVARQYRFFSYGDAMLIGD